MNTLKRPEHTRPAHYKWWRILLLPDEKGRKILDPKAWQERWRGKQYGTPANSKGILNQLQGDGVDSKYIEWLLRPEDLKGTHGHPPSRLPEKAQQEIITLLDELDALLKKMRQMVDKGFLPGRPVESFRTWLLSFEKDIEPACPQIGISPRVLKEFRKKNTKFFHGRPPDERVLITFLIADELRNFYPRRYWPIVVDLLSVRFPGDRLYCTPEKLSRAVGRLKKRAGENKVRGIAGAYREWFNHQTRQRDSLTAARGTPAV